MNGTLNKISKFVSGGALNMLQHLTAEPIDAEKGVMASILMIVGIKWI